MGKYLLFVSNQILIREGDRGSIRIHSHKFSRYFRQKMVFSALEITPTWAIDRCAMLI